MFHVPAHKNVKAPAGQVSGAPYTRDQRAIDAVEQSILEDIEPWSDIDEFFNCVRSCFRAGAVIAE